MRTEASVFLDDSQISRVRSEVSRNLLKCGFPCVTRESRARKLSGQSLTDLPAFSNVAPEVRSTSDWRTVSGLKLADKVVSGSISHSRFV